MQGKAVMDLKNWAESQQQSWIVNIWGNWFFLFISATWLIAFFVVAAISTSDYSRAKNILLQEAAEVLGNGVNEQTRDKAIESILRLQAGILRSPLTNKISWARPWIYGTAMVLSIIAIIRPKSTVGIGKGRKSIRLQNVWLWLVLKAIIGTIMISTLGLGILRKLVLG
jgi:hypothetical protein